MENVIKLKSLCILGDFEISYPVLSFLWNWLEMIVLRMPVIQRLFDDLHLWCGASDVTTLSVTEKQKADSSSWRFQILSF